LSEEMFYGLFLKLGRQIGNRDLMGILSKSTEDSEKGKYKILAIDDERDILELLKLHLERSNEALEVETAQSSEKALELIEENSYDAILADYKMPKMDGLDLLKEVRSRGIGTLYYLFTGKGGEKTSQDALKLGANGYFIKTQNPTKRITKIGNILLKNIKRRKEEKKFLIAWIIAWKGETTKELKKSLRELSDLIGFNISEIKVQEISSEKEGIKAFTKNYNSIPIEKKEIIDKWKEILSSEDSVIRADAKLDKRIQQLNDE